LAFTLLNAILNFLFAIIVLSAYLKGLKNLDGAKLCACVCFCAVPVLGILYFLLYFKLIDLAIKRKKGESCLTDIEFVVKYSHFLRYCELFLEDIPQLFIQSLNNTATGQWNTLEYVSLVFTVVTIG
jgi:hypothetical protein